MQKILIVAAVAALSAELWGCAVVAAGGAVVGAGVSVVGTAADVTGDIVSAPFGSGDSSDHKK